MSYTCVNCKSDVELEEYNNQAGVRCPYCGHRVWLKDSVGDTRAVTVG